MLCIVVAAWPRPTWKHRTRVRKEKSDGLRRLAAGLVAAAFRLASANFWARFSIAYHHVHARKVATGLPALADWLRRDLPLLSSGFCGSELQEAEVLACCVLRQQVVLCLGVMYMHVCMYTCVCTQREGYKHIHIYIYIYIHVHIHMHTWVLCMSTRKHTCTHVC